ncbi:MAG: RNA pseudouridine synthase [Candidatus Omnitrophica bacterium]|nr:RNA pseudouridine synthase [Candidatus Omnitrophota bacterium]MBU2044307.1 RNA pseudouridine synthase [Candidatus Omnitrophota bacterium]MBU2250667.1 RNA pseudouridine synthase [Candidatus Omnitrophota bacterium]MBU2265779.1 RNA pseudouridine synthase [Candidatus Omnitrophota bacterium]
MNKAFDIVFNDEYLLVVNKIAKILVQPSPKGEKITLTTLIEKELGAKVFPCHRLDRETSGLIIYAKTSQIQNQIMDQFRAGQVKKKYLGLVRGNLRPKSGAWEDSIIDKEGRRFGEKPKPARTNYWTIREFLNFSVLELEPLTGRTNQLRIQLAKAGHPILGERKYAFGKDFEVRFKRLALHAFHLSFIHPVSREKVNLRIALAKDIKEFLDKRSSI